MPQQTRIYYDFVSPYSYLALTRLAELGQRHDVVWDPAPVFYAALLDANDLVGPAETAVERRYTLTDVLRALALATACWGEGRDLTDWRVLGEVATARPPRSRRASSASRPSSGRASSSGATIGSTTWPPDYPAGCRTFPRARPLQ